VVLLTNLEFKKYPSPKIGEGREGLKFAKDVDFDEN
jgi:hypothetical protein